MSLEADYDLPYDEKKVRLGDHVVMRNLRIAGKVMPPFWKSRHGKVIDREEGFTWFKQEDGYIISENCDVKRVVE